MKKIKNRDRPTLYLVANGTSAVFYEESARIPFHFVGRLLNRKGRRTDSELVSDRYGHHFPPKFDKHEEVLKRFVWRIVRNMDGIFRKDLIENIVLVAEPHFLGLIRDKLSPTLKRLVKREVHREYKKGSDHDIREYILKALEKQNTPLVF